MFERAFEVFFSDQALVEVGLSLGENFSLGFGHARSGQALDEGMGKAGWGCMGRRVAVGARGIASWYGAVLFRNRTKFIRLARAAQVIRMPGVAPCSGFSR